jgi:hypothetical protein
MPRQTRRQQLTSLQQMRLENLHGALDLACSNGLEYLRVLIIGLLFVRRHVELEPQIAFPLAVQGVDHSQQPGAPGGQKQGHVELAIAFRVPRAVGVAARCLKNRSGLVQARSRVMRGCKPQRRALERRANFVNLAGLGHAQRAHACAAIALKNDPALAFQLTERLAHRNAADVEVLREILLPQRLARPELAFDDRLTQRLSDDFRRALTP